MPNELPEIKVFSERNIGYMICFAKEYGSFIFATGCCKITGAGLACRYSLWGHPKKYSLELGAGFAFVGFKPEYAGKLNYCCSADAHALTQISRNHGVIFLL